MSLTRDENLETSRLLREARHIILHSCGTDATLGWKVTGIEIRIPLLPV